MKTRAIPCRPLFLMLGAIAAVATVAWNAETRSQWPVGPAPEPAVSPSIESTPAPAPGAAEPLQAVETHAAPSLDAPAVPFESGMKAYLAPEGGLTHVPPQREAHPLASVPVRPERLPEVVLPDGSIKADLNGLFDEYSVMTIDESGNRVLHCVQHPDQVHDHAHPVAPVARGER